jgi:hypothetical protein
MSFYNNGLLTNLQLYFFNENLCRLFSDASGRPAGWCDDTDCEEVQLSRAPSLIHWRNAAIPWVGMSPANAGGMWGSLVRSTEPMI